MTDARPEQLPEPVDTFRDLFPDLYDHIIDWNARLGKELPFLERHLQASSAHRVLDVACGSGRHAVALAQRGYSVEGIDLNPGMLELARRHAIEHGVSCSFRPGDMSALESLQLATADAVICVGNAIPQQTTVTALRRVIKSFRATIRSGGLLVLHQRNWHRVWTRRERWMPVKSTVVDGREWLFLRFYDFEPRRRVRFHVVWLEHADNGWEPHPHDVVMRAWFTEDFDRAARKLFEPMAVHGSFDGSPYEPLESPDLVWLGRAI